MKSLILLVIFSIGLVSGRSFPKPSKDDGPSDHKCEYNGKVYNDGDELPTQHMCLYCVCDKDFVEPNNLQCAVMDCPRSEYAGLGCQPVYNETQCCPVKWNCDNLERRCECEPRYFKHYEAKGCTPEYKEGCECPVHYNCPPSLPSDPKACIYKGQSYKIGDELPSNNPCHMCSCRENFDSKAEISCISVECFGSYSRLDEGCYHVFEDGKCCPVGVECAKKNSSEPEKTCDHEGKTYHIGEKIYSNEDQCLICQCTEDWNGIQSSSCRHLDCMIEEHADTLERGCLPIYHEATCCPIEYYCGSQAEGFQNITVPLAVKEDIDSGNSCVFKGMHYKVGQVLEINHATNCVTCTCTTPPDFTCVHKLCPGPPNDDYENCASRFFPEQCCPVYECSSSSMPMHRMPALPAIIQCSPVQCPPECPEVTIGDSCPFCMCENVLCSPCREGCEEEKEVVKGRCPKCKCSDDVLDEPMCAPMKCADTCYEAMGNSGCPVCVCGPLCSPPKCDAGCRVETNIPDGQCPGCVCDSDDGLKEMIQCSPVRCPPGCKESVGDAGCPKCDCEVQCSPPKCEEGCHIDPNPTGPCPGCVCDDGRIPNQVQCSPVKCGPLCIEATGSNGCQTCLCDPMCSPPKCDPECHLNYNPALGPCPVCECSITPAIIQCSPVDCGPVCREVKGENGCMTCACGPLCSPPKCARGCHLEYDPTVSPCPVCDCDLFQASPMIRQCSPVKCDSPCREVMSSSGCPYCTCRPECSTPKCDAGCGILYQPDRCPTCVVCDNLDNPNFGIQCSMPKCGDDCEINYETKPCPSCSCPGPNFGIQCSMPKCDEPGCTINYETKPCPSCSCPGVVSGVQCSIPKCEAGCNINYETRPCPSCSCPGAIDFGIQCSMPKCEEGCTINYETKPCPSCSCPGGANLDIQCTTPQCGPGCILDYEAKPCPTCACPGAGNPNFGIQCSMPKCGDSCVINYYSKPCPSCSCPVAASSPIQCSPVQCGPGCFINYDSKPCPSCACPGAGNPNFGIQCSMPRCGPGCEINYETEPCPTCTCSASLGIQCTPVQCSPGCSLDFNFKPCPACSCPGDSSSASGINCSIPKCPEDCPINYKTIPCPSCSCSDAPISGIECTMPNCPQGCNINYETKPCPTCSCSASAPMFSPVQLVSRHTPMMFFTTDPYCAKLKCGPGCHLDPATNRTEFDRCPLCTCVDGIGKRLNCAPMQCELPCRFQRFSQYGCPTCICHPMPCPPLNCKPGTIEKHFPEEFCPRCVEDPPKEKGECSPVNCGLGCTEIPGSDGCPSCFCAPPRS